jgi:hypothetical protein
MQTIVYRYNKISSSVFVIGLLGIILCSLPSIINFLNAYDTVNWLLILIFDFLFFLMLLYIVIKQWIPALQNKAALEISKTGIISYTKNVTIEWKDVENIDLRTTRTSSLLYITFRWQTDHGNYIRIPLGFVSGSDEEIYSYAADYFKKATV